MQTVVFKANEIARLIRQYITIDQRMRGGENGEKQIKDEELYHIIENKTWMDGKMVATILGLRI